MSNFAPQISLCYKIDLRKSGKLTVLSSMLGREQ
jgi:hypothetical protein